MSDPENTKLHKDALAQAIEEGAPEEDVEYLQDGLVRHEQEDDKDED